jgi:NTP pyrophosphatase (non-canonical NTP hydrolase)
MKDWRTLYFEDCAYLLSLISDLSRRAGEADINDIADRQYSWLKRMGWTKTNALEDCGLICSEVGEAVNECRGELPTEEFGIELADIILRTLGVARKNNIDIVAKIAEKMAINDERGTRGRLK